eukprot:COSAG01_NODE_2596_length_7401_cov_12.151055_4_plen_32_part_00
MLHIYLHLHKDGIYITHIYRNWNAIRVYFRG